MISTIINLHNKWKIAKPVDAVVRISVIMTGAFIAEQGMEIFLRPIILHAEETRQHTVPKKVNKHRYDIMIRESLNRQKDFGNPASAIQTLDHLIISVKKRIRPRSKYSKKEALEVLKTIGDVLKSEGKFEYGKNNILIEGLENHRDGKRFIDCDDYSSIYLVAGERLGLPLEPVYTPKHVFLMCQLDDRKRFYWDPTIASETDISFYKRQFNLPDDCGYPKILDDEKFEALQVCNLGAAWYEKGNYEKAIKCFKRSIRLNPDFAVAHNNLGVGYVKQGSADRALECYRKAIGINPYYATAFCNASIAFFKLGQLQKAIEYYEKAIELDPKYLKVYGNQFTALMEKGEYSTAFELLNKIYDLKETLK